MRLFFAIPLPHGARHALARLRSDVGEARWVGTDQLHLTVRFLGEVDEDVARRVIARVEAAALPSLRLAIRRVGVFGSRAKARVLFAAVEPPEPLGSLARTIEACVRAVGLAPEQRPFLPHVTLARFTRSEPARLAAFLERHAELALEPFDVPALVLYRSTLGASGATHQVLHRFALGQPPTQ
jgi:RNA 2',3'-cyclic 3'-phosphodiesterase